MRDFEVLFDQAEPSPIADPAYAPYGNLGFPPAHRDRPWSYANFVQSIDGIASFLGKHPTGGDISQSEEDKWLMDLLRAHADAIIMGLNTLVEETRAAPDLNKGRGPVYRVQDSALREFRSRLGRGREKVIFVTGSAGLDPEKYRVFDGDLVDAYVLTTKTGEHRLRESGVRTMVAGESGFVDLNLGVRRLRQELGINHLLCEGGPTLYGHMSRARLIDEKFVTISPVEIGLLVPPEQQEQEPEDVQRDAPVRRPTTFTAPGFLPENAPWWQWMSCRRVGDHEFNRYRRRR
ncbi:MAG TPA: dihydrofolate reductase family protein [Terriglobales bacterium]|nr:dihydrofolate reductase family protein [Terriglobales bacterium]